MDLLVSTDWLADHLAEDDLVVLDCTVHLTMSDAGFVSESGRAAFNDRHIPGAGFADLNEELVDTSGPDRYAMPTPEHFGAAMERLGVADGRRVVLYDDNGSMWAARVWFMLRWIGVDDAAILDGGMKAWLAEDRATESGPGADRSVPAGSLSLTPRPRLVADKDEVMAAIGDGATCLIDALPPSMYSGKVAPYGRPGHIPGAMNAPASAMVDADTGRFKPLDEIQAMLPERHEARTVAY